MPLYSKLPSMRTYEPVLHNMLRWVSQMGHDVPHVAMFAWRNLHHIPLLLGVKSRLFSAGWPAGVFPSRSELDLGKPWCSPPFSHHEKPKEAHQVPFWAWMFASENPWPLGGNGESLAVVVGQKTRCSVQYTHAGFTWVYWFCQGRLERRRCSQQSFIFLGEDQQNGDVRRCSQWWL